MATTKGKRDEIKAHAAKRKVSQVRSGNAEYKGYVQYPRTNATKSQFEAWANESSDISDVINTAIAMGYRLTISLENDGESVKAAFYQNDNQRIDAGLGISAFADDYWDALVRVSFFLGVWGNFNLGSEIFQQPDSKVKKDFWG